MTTSTRSVREKAAISKLQLSNVNKTNIAAVGKLILNQSQTHQYTTGREILVRPDEIMTSGAGNALGSVAQWTAAKSQETKLPPLNREQQGQNKFSRFCLSFSRHCKLPWQLYYASSWKILKAASGFSKATMRRAVALFLVLSADNALTESILTGRQAPVGCEQVHSISEWILADSARIWPGRGFNKEPLTLNYKSVHPTINENFVNIDGNESSFVIQWFLGPLNTNIVTATLSEVPGSQGKQYQRRIQEFHGKLMKYFVETR
ncbi:hypothetical protein TSAR_016247 [Trichomalopsis sarcophagae]|uniref:Uncharacterized protein n=1 Tax=Trichomalopsis sarcophagae TaxID=543379 RepID=A0A232ENX3_9HYME|nr:hypothetical protein TSAR_016247 [Trichomalopsis sarcophagae]